MDERKAFTKSIVFNGSLFTTIVIDQHYKENHCDITDELILAMLELRVHNTPVHPDSGIDQEGFQYFKVDPLEYQGLFYRLILVTCLTENFLGVVNAFRVEKKI